MDLLTAIGQLTTIISANGSGSDDCVSHTNLN
jgi:hypothetical protein